MTDGGISSQGFVEPLVLSTEEKVALKQWMAMDLGVEGSSEGPVAEVIDEVHRSEALRKMARTFLVFAHLLEEDGRLPDENQPRSQIPVASDGTSIVARLHEEFGPHDDIGEVFEPSNLGLIISLITDFTSRG